MARIVSITMSVFVLIPAVAPAIGQALLTLVPWRSLFVILSAIALISGLWLACRQPETLSKAHRLNVKQIVKALTAVLADRTAVSYSIAGGFCYGALLGYINSAHQLFIDVYFVGGQFALLFGINSLFVAIATILNAQLVKHFDMQYICRVATGLLVIWSSAFGVFILATDGVPHLMVWMAFNTVCMFCLGLTFGNFSAIALKNLGKSAGAASALVGTIITILAIVISAVIGFSFDNTVGPMTLGYLLCGCGALAIMVYAKRTVV